MGRFFKGIAEILIYLFSFLISEDLTRLDRRMRIIGIALMFAVIAFLSLWERFET